MGEAEEGQEGVGHARLRDEEDKVCIGQDGTNKEIRYGVWALCISQQAPEQIDSAGMVDFLFPNSLACNVLPGHSVRIPKVDNG